MSEQLSYLDGESEIKDAFASFDADDSGLVDAATLRRYLKEEGDTMTDDEVSMMTCQVAAKARTACADGARSPAQIDRLLNGPFLDKKGRFDYNAFCSTLRVTDADEAPAQLA